MKKRGGHVLQSEERVLKILQEYRERPMEEETE